MILTRPTSLCFLAGIVLFAPAALGQGEKKALPIDDYARWRSIASTAIAGNGDWMVFAYTQRETDPVLHVKHLDSDKQHEIERGSNPQLSDDSKWVAYFLNLPFAEAEKLRKGNKPVPRKVELMNLASGEKLVWDDVTSFSFSKGA